MNDKSRAVSARQAGVAVLLLLAALIVVAAVLPLPPAAHRAAAGSLVVACYLGFCLWVGLARRAAASPAGGPIAADALLVAYASQTGFAEQIARRSAQALQAAGLPVHLANLAEMGGSALQRFRKALFVVSTTGEGDAPDGAASFARKTLAGDLALAGLSYGVLALGDSSYQRYCAFGQSLANWLHRQGAEPLFDPILVDDGDEGALRHWQHYLNVLGASADMEDWAAPSYQPWTLAERRLLNEGSPGDPAYHLALVAAAASPGGWEAGDIAEIGPRNDPGDVASLLAALDLDGAMPVDDGPGKVSLRDALAARVLPHDEAGRAALRGLPPSQLAQALPRIPHREYSIASLPADGRLELLVRQMRYPGGRLGMGSGWLTRHVPQGGQVDVRLRRNSGFHPPPPGRPLILIGNGTGMAGLRAHLKARAAVGARRNWLLFGERTPDHDFFHRGEIEAWREQGVLERLDLAFSRAAGWPRYVQDCLPAVAGELRAWVDEGAAIYVCGSLQGMAAGVAAELERILGRDRLDELAGQGRYRRDVY
ncbi:MAG: sulfite reductase flavoprotein subunit alpha [Alcaligenaceae bacterium]|nr:sulfite reductase flavoprotein subunit alpha [Alcaligenaceae bacterium SAGV5]MPS54286.1 sulfite reductase flavoprotein subunit alpha [Alcaligenaceae bacterium SAGV3]MPT60181.1 sulfite reductase flavoprotein subunit alpha [Alcaligenaceae bacterium]